MLMGFEVDSRTLLACVGDHQVFNDHTGVNDAVDKAKLSVKFKCPSMDSGGPRG